MTLFERIENLRKSKGISQGKLEKELGFSNGSISKWKISTPTPERLQKLADYFGVSIEYLMTGFERQNNTALKDRIVELARKKGISLPALESELGFGNSTIVKWDKSTPNAEKLNAVAQYFGVTMDYLLNGSHDSLSSKDKDLILKPKDEKEIQNIISATEQLLKQEGLMFDGDPASPEAIDSILSAMQIGMEMAKKKNKEKYTPKKYKKD